MLQKQIEQQIAKRIINNPSSYFNNYVSLIKKTFNTENFYLRANQFVIYFQQYDIAPYYTGIPEFSFTTTIW